MLREDRLQIDARTGYQRCGLDLTALVAEVFQHFALDPTRVRDKGRRNALATELTIESLVAHDAK